VNTNKHSSRSGSDGSESIELQKDMRHNGEGGLRTVTVESPRYREDVQVKEVKWNIKKMKWGSEGGRSSVGGGEKGGIQVHKTVEVSWEEDIGGGGSVRSVSITPWPRTDESDIV
jgi:hypothetical protein